MDIRKEFKVMLTREGLNNTSLAKLLSEKTGKNITQQSISGKLLRNSLKIGELTQICDILGYDIEFKKR